MSEQTSIVFCQTCGLSLGRMDSNRSLICSHCESDLVARPRLVLWISRHKPMPEQLLALEARLGPVTIVQRDVALDNNPERGAEEVATLISEVGADEMVGVMPVAHLAALTRKGIFPVRAVMTRTPTGKILPNGEKEYEFGFDHFERILRVEVIVEVL